MALVAFPERWAAKPPLGVDLNRNHPLVQGLVGAWLMNDNAGPTVRDKVNGNHGTIVGAIPWVVGRAGLALSTPGTGGTQVDLGNPPVLNITGRITVSAWIRFTAAQSNNPIVAKWGSNPSYTLLMLGTNTVAFALYVSGNVKSATYPTQLNDGFWHNAVGVFDGNNVLIYVDGVCTIGDATAGPIASSTDVVRFSNYSNFNDGFQGYIDDVRIWNRALTGAEILRLYTDPYGIMQPQSPERRYWFPVSPGITAVSVELARRNFRPRMSAPGLAR